MTRRSRSPHEGRHDPGADDVRASAFVGPPLRWLMPVRQRWRMATAGLRVLPDFVIVGAQKAGTTSLYAWLASHPDVLRAAAKEIHFFDTCDWYRGVDAYRASFPLRAHVRLASRLRRRRVVTGEATPYYLYHPLAALRLLQVVPQVKVIILLRDPVERTLSHHRHEVRCGRETLPLREALCAEAGRLAGHEAALIAGDPPCRHLVHRNFSYVDRSRYARQVARYLELFPAGQVLVLRSEDLFADKPEAKRRLTQFLGLSPLTQSFDAQNLGHRSSGDAEEATVRQMLGRELAGDREALSEFLGEGFDWPEPEPEGRKQAVGLVTRKRTSG